MERDNPACGVRTTGEVVDAGFMPLAEDGAVFRCISVECGALAFKRGLQRDGSCMCGASVHRLGGVLADQYRTLHAKIAEQAAEIERLKKNYEDAAGAFVIARESSATRHLAAQQMIAEQNELRTEIERLIRVHGEQMETIAALEAERDALCDELDAANARAEKYFAVIKAKDAEILALGQAWTASMATGQAMQEAGIQFRHVSQDIPPFVAEETE